MSTHLCDYGCGRPSIHTFKNGKKCCSKSTNSCSELNKTRMKNLLNNIQIQKQTIDPTTGSSLTSLRARKREEIKRKTVDPETGLTMNTVGAINAAKTKSETIDPKTGLNINQLAGLKSFKTTSTTIDSETGLTQRELQGRRHSEYLQTINPETGLTNNQIFIQKGTKAKLKIGEDGLNSHERGWINSLKMYYYKDTKILYQSNLEKKFLEQLETDNGIVWLEENVKRGPNIKYFHPIKKEEKLYMSDFLVEDVVYEIKSNWTWNGDGKRLDWQEINEAKLEATKQAGWNVTLLILS